MIGKAIGLGLVILASAWSSKPLHAQSSPDPFYAGKTIDLLVGSEAGSGYDTYARLVARYLPKHIPGHPKVTVKQMVGAGGVIATNYLANIAPKDGTVISQVQNTVPFQPLVSPTGIQFKPTELGYIGSANSEVTLVFTWGTSPTKTFDDLRRRETIMGAVNSSISSTYARALNRLADTKIKIVTGYAGAGQAMLAMENGETEGYPAIFWSTLKATKADWVAHKRINLLVQLALEKHAELPDVPLVMDYLHDANSAAAMRVILAPQVGGRPFMAPPNLPPERLAVLRKAFADTMQDSDLLAEAKMRQIELSYTSGDDLAKLIREVYAMPAETLARARDLMR